MQSLFRTLKVEDKVGESIIGTTYWGPRFEQVSVGRSLPSLKKVEDAEAILRCGFLDIGSPIEVNMVHSESMRLTLHQRVLMDSDTKGWLDPESLVRTHPSLGHLPAELFSAPNVAGLRAFAGSSVASEAVVRLRLKATSRSPRELNWSEITSEDLVSDATFWTDVAKSDLYPRLMGDLLARGERFRLSVPAPPVPVLHEDWTRSADLQFELNAAATALMRPPSGSVPGIRPMCSLHLHPSALGEPTILNRSLDLLRLALASAEYGFVGTHLSFTDLGAIGLEGAPAVRMAKDFAAKVINITADGGRFTMVSDTGPVGPAFLDIGAAFSTYGMGMTMHRTYPIMKPASKKSPAIKKRAREGKYGKVLGGPWNYVLLHYRDVRNQDWTLEDLGGKFENVVPRSLQGGPDDRYRIDFSKPYNTAVQETLNDSRERELVRNKNARPGKSTLGKSEDSTIAPWA